MSLSTILGKLATYLKPDTSGFVSLVNQPVQFDNTAKLSNTSWIKTRGVQYGDVIIINVSTILDASYAGKVVIFYGNTASITATLPASSSLTNGVNIKFVNMSGFNCIVSRGGTDAISAVGNTMNVNIYDTLDLFIFNTTWEMGGGSACLPYIVSFNGTPTAAAGYQKFPGGLIMQWGNWTTTSQSIPVTFPIAFPTGATAVTFAAASATSACMVGSTALTRTGFTGVSYSYNGTFVQVGSFYIAMGY